jgi:hypothetical protein
MISGRTPEGARPRVLDCGAALLRHLQGAHRKAPEGWQQSECHHAGAN